MKKSGFLSKRHAQLSPIFGSPMVAFVEIFGFDLQEPQIVPASDMKTFHCTKEFCLLFFLELTHFYRYAPIYSYIKKRARMFEERKERTLPKWGV